MDGDITPTMPAGLVPAQHRDRARPSRLRRVVWFGVVGFVLAAVLGGLYWFEHFRENAIANFFAHNKPPPAQIAAVVATTQAVPHYAAGIGSLAAVHQVTVTPEVGGRITEIGFDAGTKVRAGYKLIQLNDAPDKGDLANYEAQARWATVSLQRASELAKHQYGSLENVDQQQSNLDQANAQIEKIKAILAQKQVRAPFAGELGVRQVEVGQYVNAGAPIVTLTDLSTLYVNFTLPSQLRSEIRVGQKVDVTADAFPGRRFGATITTIEPQLRSDMRTLMVQATMSNPDESLLPGMFVNAAVVLPEAAQQVVLPETAVDYTLYGDSVYAIRADGSDANGKPVLKAYRTPVKTGLRWGDKVEIVSGVKAGEQVVAAGQLKVQDGSTVVVTGNPPPQPPANPTPQ